MTGSPFHIGDVTRGIQFRTTLLASVVVFLALALGGVALVVATRASYVDAIATAMRTRAEDIAALASEGTLPRVLPGRADALLTQVVSASGVVIASTPGVADGAPLSEARLSAGEVMQTDATIAESDADVAGAAAETEPIMLYGRGVATPQGPVTIFVGALLEPADEAVSALVPVLLGVFAALLVLVAGIVWVLSGRALAPVEAIRSQADAIGVDDLGLRVPVPDTRDEIALLAETMNRMLDRLDESAQAQRRFVADASHELRSPVAAMRTMLEVAQQHPEAVQYPTLVEDLLREDVRLERLTADLLALARYDEHGPAAHASDVDVCTLVAEEAEAARGRSSVEVRTHLEASPSVRGDHDRLLQALRNLIDNALLHADRIVWVSCAAVDRVVTVTVSDDGPGVPTDQREAVFGRFVRLDDARSRESGGTGLGLAVCRAVVEEHGGAVECVEPEHGGATFQVRLPY